MKEVFNSAQVLINVAERAQKAGILTLDEAVQVKQSIDIQTDYYKQLAEKLNEPEDMPTPEQPKKQPVKRAVKK